VYFSIAGSKAQTRWLEALSAPAASFALAQLASCGVTIIRELIYGDFMMFDFPQFSFDGAEEIAEALHAQEGIEAALRAQLPSVLADVASGQEQMVMALVGAMAHYRNTASQIAERLARQACEVPK
jgi:hypothetical protein